MEWGRVYLEYFVCKVMNFSKEKQLFITPFWTDVSKCVNGKVIRCQK